jgi:ankyrin repeat protein
MGRILDFLTEEFLRTHYGSREEAIKPPTLDDVTAPATATGVVRQALSRGLLHESDTASFVDLCLGRGQLARAWGASAEQLRAIWRAGALAFEPVLAALDFAPRERVRDRATPKEAEVLQTTFGAEIAPSTEGKQFVRATYTAVPQPERDAFYKALLCAVLAHERDLAERLAQGYPARPAELIADDYYGHKTGVLREIVLGDDEAARRHLDRLPGGYIADFPQDRLELPQGLLEGSEALLRKGVRKIGTRFAGNWNPKKHEEWAKKHHRPLNEVLDGSRHDLLALHWVLSEWGVAYMSLAVRRGLTGLLSDPKAWSEWLPRSLCSDQPLPDEAPPKQRKAAAKPKPPVRPKASAKPVPGPGPTPLHEAVVSEDLQAISALIAEGADLEARDHRAFTALLRAVWDENLEATRLLLGAGADPDAVDDRSRAALHFLAAQTTATDIAKALLARGADVEIRLSDGSTPLQITRSPEMAEVLLAAGAKINAQNDLGSTALYRLVWDNKHDVALLLLDNGADPRIARHDGLTPLHAATARDAAEVAGALIERGADVNSISPYGIAPLHLAVGLRRVGIATLLLRHGADPNLRRTDVPADFAAYVKQTDLVLLYTGEQRKRQYNLAPGATPLHFAAIAKASTDLVQLLLEHGADPDITDSSGRTALDWAREYKESRTVKLLAPTG